MRVIQVTTAAVTLRAFLAPLARYFRALGWKVDAAASGATGCSACRAAFDQVLDVGWSRNPFDPRNFCRAARQVREIVEQGDYDLVHVHTPVAAFVTRYALRRLRAQGRPKVIYSAHGFHFHSGGDPIRNVAFLGLEKLAGRWTDYLIVINPEDDQAARRHRIVPGDRVRYMPGIGLDTADWAPERVPAGEVRQVRSDLGLASGQPLFVMVAEFIPRKRHRDALHAFARLRRREAHLALVGEGRLFESIQRLGVRLGIAERVHLLGFRADVPALIRAAMATILPSEREGLPRSVMESLSLEVPVIGASARGTRELLEGGCGLLVPVGDVDGLGGAMAWVLDHPEEARLMGEHGRRRMARYDIRHILRQHELLYAEALGEESRAVANA